MSSTIDPAKLKVVELRAELSKRGLDSKGNKPALVKRLKEALEEELKQELPDTSIADTSTEDLDSSQNQDSSTNEESTVPDKPKPEEIIPEEKIEKAPEDEAKTETEENPVEVPKEPEPEEIIPEDKPEEEIEEKEEITESLDENKKNGEQDSKPADINDVQISEKVENETEPNKEEIDAEPKGEKRRRSSVSPDRSQRRRSKSPIKEDEPSIDTDKVQLSWYDSDLHLQVDKESFLSAKPYHEGAFGFAWAGVRATHGVNIGKVCFEVKITEELKWEDFSKYYDKHRRDQHKSSSKHKDDDRKKEDTERKEKEPKQEEIKMEQENGDKPEENDEEMKELKTEEPEKMETEESEQDKIKKEPDEDKIKKEPEDDKIKKEPEDDKIKKEPEEDEKIKKEPEEEKKIKEETEEKKEPEATETLPTHLFRVGWSLLNSGLQLGEDKFSYGYESSGRFVVNKEFQNYGIEFGVGDVISSFLYIDDEKVNISYAVNGLEQGEALSLPITDLPENFVLFPHILSRNYAFELNLGSKDESWFTILEGFQFLDKIENKIQGPIRPENRSDCEVILMCGLPASGKTHWVREYIQQYPEKKYTVLGNSHLLEKMTVSGDALKSKYKGSWNILLEKLQKCLNKLIEIASLRRRNYIIDQPNVYPSAQRRKLRPFEGFKRRAVVVVVGDEEQAKRQSLQEAEGGKDVPDSTVLDMKANMSLPQKSEWIDEVTYAGVNEEEAKTIVQKYNSSARETIGIQRRFGHGDRDRHRWQNRRNDYRGNYRDRNYHNNRYDRGPPRQGNWHQMRPGGWNRDRRDNRGPSMGGSRDWRNRGGNSRDRGNRDSHNQTSNYNRNRNQPRGPSGNWPSNWSQNQSNWGGNQPWSQGSWNDSNWSSSNNQNQWKYGGGSQNYGGYSNWNYYGQYPQNWGSQQGQTHSTSNTAGTNQYGQYSQQDWAQYAQQYAQQGQTTTSQSTPQK